MEASDLDKNLKIRVQHLLNKEVIDLELSAEAEDRYLELARVLNPYHLYFVDEYFLVDDRSELGEEPIAELISNPDDLTCWLINDPDFLD